MKFFRIIVIFVLLGISLTGFSGVRESFQKGNQFFLNKKYEDAVAVLKSNVKKYPDHSPSHLILARSYYGLKNFKLAARHFSQYQISQMDAEAVYEAGVSFMKNKDYERSKKSFLRIRSSNPNYDIAKYFAGVSAMKLDQYAEARSHFQKALMLPERLSENKKLYLQHIDKILTMRKKRELAKDLEEEKRKVEQLNANSEQNVPGFSYQRPSYPNQPTVQGPVPHYHLPGPYAQALPENLQDKEQKKSNVKSNAEEQVPHALAMRNYAKFRYFVRQLEYDYTQFESQESQNFVQDSADDTDQQKPFKSDGNVVQDLQLAYSPTINLQKSSILDAFIALNFGLEHLNESPYLTSFNMLNSGRMVKEIWAINKQLGANLKVLTSPFLAPQLHMRSDLWSLSAEFFVTQTLTEHSEDAILATGSTVAGAFLVKPFVLDARFEYLTYDNDETPLRTDYLVTAGGRVNLPLDFSVYLQSGYRNYEYQKLLLDGPNSVIHAKFGIKNNFKGVLDANISVAYEDLQGYIFSRLDENTQVNADGQATTLEVNLAVKMIQVLELGGNYKVSMIDWLPADAQFEQLILENTPNYIADSNFFIGLNLEF